MKEMSMAAADLATSGRLKLAELTSTLGAGVIGAGVGLLLASYLRDFAIPIFALGLLMHLWGMTDKHAIETRGGAVPPRWATLLYWFCWVALLAMAAYAVLRSANG
jgi:hypothetical protein